MKTKKIKLVKLFKIGIILFSSSLLLWNCEKEQLDESYQPKTTLEKIQSSFNKEDFKKVIPYEFEVIWKDNKKQYSDELKTTYHQFDLSYTSLLTPYINYTKKKKGDYHKSYKLIVTVDKKQQLNFYVLRTYEKILETGSPIARVNLNNNSTFNGLIHLVDKQNDIVFAKKLNKGKNSIKDYYNKEFKELDPLKNKMIESCVTIKTEHWYYYYQLDGEFFLMHKKLLNTSYEKICAYEYLPEFNSGEGGGGSSGSSPNGGGTYQTDCSNTSSKTRYLSKEDEDCAVKITEEIVECEKGYIPDENGNCVEVTVDDINPSCESFNYSQVGGTNWQCAAVSNVHELFTIINWDCLGYDWGIFTQPLYFQLPINQNFAKNSGLTKLQSAVYLDEAFKSFDVWYKQNGCTTSGPAMSQKLLEYIKAEFEEQGGSVTLTPPLGFSGTPTPYKRALIGNGNCL